MQSKLVIYQLLPRVFANKNKNCVENGSLDQNGSGKFNDFDNKILKSLKSLPVTHVWFTGVIFHATKSDLSYAGLKNSSPSIVKGEAGSPYAIRDYYDVNPYLASDPQRRMEEFENLVCRCKEEDLGVIIDFVPNHVAREYSSLNLPSLGSDDDETLSFSPKNNFYYLPGERLVIGDYVEYPAKATGNDSFTTHPEINDWYETVKLNYGVDYVTGKGFFDPIPDTWHKMFNILIFWRSKGVSGFRCDMAEMVPVEFWCWAIKKVKRHYPDTIFIAEIYNPSLYQQYAEIGGFDYLYDKVGMYDTLIGVLKGERGAGEITKAWQATDSLQEKMLYFLENHDEQRIASYYMLKDGFKAIPALTISLLFNKAPFLLYGGEEFGETGMYREGFSGEDGRSTIYDYWSIDVLRRFIDGVEKGEVTAYLSFEEERLYMFYKIFLSIASTPIISCGGTFDLGWLNSNHSGFDANSHFAFIRYYEEEIILSVSNFADREYDLSIYLSEEIFTKCGIRNGEEYIMTDMITEDSEVVTLFFDRPLSLCISASDIRLLHFRIK